MEPQPFHSPGGSGEPNFPASDRRCDIAQARWLATGPSCRPRPLRVHPDYTASRDTVSTHMFIDPSKFLFIPPYHRHP